eukprot:scaffold24310_cov113-Isochrysis_galbana.AAC.3
MGRWPALGPLSRVRHDEILAPWAKGLRYFMGPASAEQELGHRNREGTSGLKECWSGGPASLWVDQEGSRGVGCGCQQS